MLGGRSKGLVLDARPNYVTPTSLEDQSGNGNHGTFTNITTTPLVSGLYQFNFNGASSKIDCGNNNSLNPASISMEQWVKLNDLTSDVSDIVGRGFFNRIFVNTNGSFATVIKAGGVEDTLVSGTAILLNDIWYHLIATYDGTNMKLYKNGNLLITKAHSNGGDISANTNNTTYGLSSAAKWLNGSMALQREFNYATPDHYAYTRFQSTREKFGV